MIIFKKNIYNYIIIHNNNSYKIQNFIIYEISFALYFRYQTIRCLMMISDQLDRGTFIYR